MEEDFWKIVAANWKLTQSEEDKRYRKEKADNIVEDMFKKEFTVKSLEDELFGDDDEDDDDY